MRILRQSEVGATRLVPLSLLLTLTEITMTTGSAIILMEQFVQSTIPTFLLVRNKALIPPLMSVNKLQEFYSFKRGQNASILVISHSPRYV